MIKNAAFLPGDLNLLARETEMFRTTVDSLAADEMSAPALREGRTRADVLVAAIRAADTMTGLVAQAVGQAVGQAQAPSAAGETRADLPASELKNQVGAALDRVTEATRSLTDGVTSEQVTLQGRDVDTYWLPSLWTSQAVLLHHDLDTVWELEEADITALEDAMEIVAIRLRHSADESAPGLRLLTTEGEEHVIGDGAHTVRGDREALLAWITRGETDGVRTDEGELPDSPMLLDLL